MASSSAPPVTLDLAAEYHALRTLYDRQNEQGHALVADLAKAKAEKEALHSRLDRGGPIRLTRCIRSGVLTPIGYTRSRSRRPLDRLAATWTRG